MTEGTRKAKKKGTTRSSFTQAPKNARKKTARTPQSDRTKSKEDEHEELAGFQDQVAPSGIEAEKDQRSPHSSTDDSARSEISTGKEESKKALLPQPTAGFGLQRPQQTLPKDTQKPSSLNAVQAAENDKELFGNSVINRLLDQEANMASPFLSLTSGRQDGKGKTSKATHSTDATTEVDNSSAQGKWAMMKKAKSAAGHVFETVGRVQDMAAERVDLKAYRSSPRVAVLWKTAEGPDFAALEAESVHVLQRRTLPENDCFLFIVGRPPDFLRNNLCGSVASEIESLRCAVRRCVADVGDVRDCYDIWPLHDHKLNMLILAKAFTAAPTKKHGFCRKESFTGMLRIRTHAVLTWLGLRLHNSELAGLLQAHFGSDTALSFLFTYHYIKSLWVLALVSLVFWMIKLVGSHANVNPDYFRAYVQPLYQTFVLFPWSLWFFVRWNRRLNKASTTFLADKLTNDDDVNTEVRPEFRPWRPSESMEYYPWQMRVLKTLLVAPLVFLMYCLMVSVVGIVFLWEIYIIFEWGKCNKDDPLCDSAAKNRGLKGLLYEMIPGLVEGILFEILLAISKAIAKLAVKLQNWRTRTQAQLAFMVQVYMCEFISKFGFVSMLGLAFVPDWTHFTCGDYRDTIAGMLGLEKLFCLKEDTLYSTRLTLFENAVEAPFYVSQIVSMLIKTLMPMIVSRLRSCYPNDHGADNGCRSRCCRVLLRLLSCAFLLDGTSVAAKSSDCEDCVFLRNGDTIGQELAQLEFQAFRDSAGSNFESDRRNSANMEHFFGDHVKMGPLMLAWKEGIREGYEASIENLETSMHFCWVICFAALKPHAVVIAVAVYIFDVRLDLLRLTMVQRRCFRQSPKAGMQLFVLIMYLAIGFAIIFNITVADIVYAGIYDHSGIKTMSLIISEWSGTHISEGATLTAQVNIILVWFIIKCVVFLTIHVLVIRKFASPDYDALEQVFRGRERIRLWPRTSSSFSGGCRSSRTFSFKSLFKTSTAPTSPSQDCEGVTPRSNKSLPQVKFGKGIVDKE